MIETIEQRLSGVIGQIIVENAKLGFEVAHLRVAKENDAREIANKTVRVDELRAEVIERDARISTLERALAERDT